MKTTRNICILLILCLLFSIMVSCAGDNGNAETAETTSSVSDSVAEVTESTRIDPGLPDDIRYDGYEFRVLTKGQTNVHWKSFDIAADEINGEPLNDAVYNRNMAINEKYGVTVVDIPGNYANLAADALKAITAGDDAYDMLCFQAASLITDGYLVDLYDIPYMNLDQPYYDQNIIDSFTILGKLYAVTGDMLTMDNDATWCVQFNKKIAEDLSFDTIYGKSMYDIVDEGKWTMDLLYETARLAVNDVNGDGVMTELTDVWGYQTQHQNNYMMFAGAGEVIARVGSDGYPQITLSSDRVMSVLEKAIGFQIDKETGMNANYITGYADVWGEVMDGNFQQSLALYNIAGLNRVTLFRSMEVDFGILPLPKYDENQDSYYSSVVIGCANYITVPKTATDLERTGIIIEALSCESRYTVLPAYYDNTLKTKASRDEESSDMLDLIFDTTVFDIGEFFSWGGIHGTISNMTDPGKIASTLATAEASINTQMGKTITAIEENS